MIGCKVSKNTDFTAFFCAEKRKKGILKTNKFFVFFACIVFCGSVN